VYVSASITVCKAIYFGQITASMCIGQQLNTCGDCTYLLIVVAAELYTTATAVIAAIVAAAVASAAGLLCQHCYCACDSYSYASGVVTSAVAHNTAAAAAAAGP
jgi:hypothetical protein